MLSVKTVILFPVSFIFGLGMVSAQTPQKTMWAWGATMRRRRAAVLGLLGGGIVGICAAIYKLYLFQSLGTEPSATERVLFFPINILLYAVPGFLVGKLINTLDKVKADYGLTLGLFLPLFTARRAA